MTLELQIENAIGYHRDETLALGYLRYEALRKLAPRQFSDLHKRNLKGENFDAMVDEMVLSKNK